jgi:hypothetical protein
MFLARDIPVLPEKSIERARSSRAKESGEGALLKEMLRVLGLVLQAKSIPYPLIFDIRFSAAEPRKARLD